MIGIQILALQSLGIKLISTMSVPVFNGTRALGCEMQVIRARSAEESLESIRNQMSAMPQKRGNNISRAEDFNCGCSICENGCIDVSLCPWNHTMAIIPIMNRWCDATTSLIPGGGHLIFWSGWARPSVLKLTDRYCTVAHVKRMIKRSHKSTLHTNFRFDFVWRHDTILQLEIIDIIPHFHSEKQYLKVHQLLSCLDDNTVIGDHGTLPSSGST